MANRTGAYITGVTYFNSETSQSKSGFTNTYLPRIVYMNTGSTSSSPVYQAIRVRINVLYSTGSTWSSDWVSVSTTGWNYNFTSDDLTDVDIQLILEGQPSLSVIPVTFEMQSQLVGSSEWITEETSSYMTVDTHNPPVISNVSVIDTNPDTRNIMGSPYSDLVLTKSTVDMEFGSIACQDGTIIKTIDIYYPVKQPYPDVEDEEMFYFENFDDGEHNPTSTLTNYRVNLIAGPGGLDPENMPTFALDLPYDPGIPITPNNNGDHCIMIRVVDSRGNTAEYKLFPSTFEYVDPYVRTTIERVDGYYPQTDITVNCTYSKFPNSLDQPRNHITIKCWYKKTSDQSYDPTTETNLTDGQATRLTLDNSYSWNILVSIQDDWMAAQNPAQWKNYEYTVGAGVPILFIDKKKHSVGINCLPQHNNDLEVNGVPIGNSSSIQQVTITENVSMASQYGYFQLSQALNYPAPNASLICMTTRTPSIAMTSGTIYSLANWSDGNRPFIQYQHGGTDFQNIPHDFIFTFFVP